jgi:hypothetical protein
VTRIAKQRASLTKSLLSEQLMYRTRSSSTVSDDDLARTFSSDTVEQQLRYSPLRSFSPRFVLRSSLFALRSSLFWCLKCFDLFLNY